MTTEEQRHQRLKLQDDHIGRSLRESEENGELRAAPSYGKPLDFGDGYEQTPADMRMGFKILKDGGYVPPEIETMREITRLQEAQAKATDAAEGESLAKRINELRQHLALRLEKLRMTGSL